MIGLRSPTSLPDFSVLEPYAFEIVRDTVRFTKVKDNCPAREEHMAWGWKKAESQGARRL